MKTIVPIYICNFQTVHKSAVSIHLSHRSSEQYGIKEIHVVNKKIDNLIGKKCRATRDTELALESC